jgi:hypothetical protein
MSEKLILLICQEPGQLEPLRGQFSALGAGQEWYVAVADAAEEQIECDEFALVIAYHDGAGRMERVAALLDARSRARRVPAIVTISDSYDPTEALTLFRMGVTDHLSLADQHETMRSVVESLLGLGDDGTAARRVVPLSAADC